MKSSTSMSFFFFSETIKHFIPQRLLQTMLSFASHPSHLVSSVVLPFWNAFCKSKKFINKPAFVDSILPHLLVALFSKLHRGVFDDSGAISRKYSQYLFF